MSKFISVHDYAMHFGFTILSGHKSVKTKCIEEMPINRPGFELCGVFEATDCKRLVIIGNKEYQYICNKGEDHFINAYDFLTNDECPAIVICRGLPCPPKLLEIATKKDFPILSTSMSTSEMNVATFTYLQEALAPSISLHASFIEIYSMGVLIMGESGIGKSETTLELIKKGHKLIADDRVNIKLIRDELIGEAPELIQGVMEVRGIGIIDVQRLFGINSLVKKKKVSYCINLVPFKSGEPYDRLGNQMKMFDVLSQNIPQLNLPVSAARSMAEIIEVAVTNLKLKDDGFDSSYEFENRMNELLTRKKGV